MTKGDLIFVWIVIAMSVLIYNASFNMKNVETINGLKYNNCVTEMQKAIPDPNDTEERSKFLKECFN